MAVVVDVEHLDGSAVIAQYHDHEGKQRWVEHKFSDIPFDDVPTSARSEQLRQVRYNTLMSALSIYGGNWISFDYCNIETFGRLNRLYHCS